MVLLGSPVTDGENESVVREAQLIRVALACREARVLTPARGSTPAVDVDLGGDHEQFSSSASYASAYLCDYRTTTTLKYLLVGSIIVKVLWRAELPNAIFAVGVDGHEQQPRAYLSSTPRGLITV